MGLELDFKGKNIIVTGGTKGIGKAIATQYLMNGGKVTVTGTKEISLSKLKQQWGFSNIEYQKVDFLNKNSLKRFLNWISKQEKIDILVNNAVLIIIDVDSSETDFDNLFDVNLKAPYLLSKLVSRKMKKNGSGKIANISSIWSSITRPGRSIYSSTKFGIVGLTKTLAVELASYGVLVNAIAPGFTMTELTKKTNTSKELEELRKTIPIKKLANPVEIAQLVLFLTSDLNTYLTGQNIIIDGGYSVV